jgi:amino acid transporter
MLMTQKDPFEPDIVARALAKNRLGVPSVVFFGVAGAAPLTVIIGAISATYAIIGSTAVPIAYVAVAAILSLFTVGFVAMSRHIVNSGAFYSYISLLTDNDFPKPLHADPVGARSYPY